jgi:hypothetical protein
LRVQLSLELLLYVSLVGISSALVLGILARNSSGLRSELGAFAVSQFVNSVNGAILGGAVREGVFLPGGVCGSQITGALLSYGNESFAFVEPVHLVGNALCPDGIAASLQFTYNASGAYVSR